MNQRPLDPDVTTGPKPSRCPCGRPSWAMVVDLCLELQAAREALAVVDSDTVEMIAVCCATAYALLGGEVMTLSAWRVRARELLLDGEVAR
jgi:hypothetical protein